MSNIVIFDPNGIVNNRVINYLRSANTPDYENLSNVLINPDVSLLENISVNYWKVSENNVVEMSSNEKTIIDNSINAKNIRQKLYKISSYDANQRLLSVTYFDTDNGDATYSGIAEQTTYTYFDNNVTLLHRKTETFCFDGTIYLTENYDYYKNDNNELIEKKV